MKQRGFKKISKKQFKKDFEDMDVDLKDILLPKRATKGSAGYDFFAPFDIKLKPKQSITIPTGIKVYLLDNEFLDVRIRSSLGFKYNIRIVNQCPIIDSDYYDNKKNEGHIKIKIENEGNRILNLKQGEGFVQGIFSKYFLANDDETKTVRKGGIGSTTKNKINKN